MKPAGELLAELIEKAVIKSVALGRGIVEARVTDREVLSGVAFASAGVLLDFDEVDLGLRLDLETFRILEAEGDEIRLKVGRQIGLRVCVSCPTSFGGRRRFLVDGSERRLKIGFKIHDLLFRAGDHHCDDDDHDNDQDETAAATQDPGHGAFFRRLARRRRVNRRVGRRGGRRR